MGDAADDMIDREIDRQIYPFGIDVLFADPIREQTRFDIGNSVWTTKEGSEVKFKNMGLRHFANVLRLVEARGHKHVRHLRDYYEYRVTVENHPNQ